MPTSALPAAKLVHVLFCLFTIVLVGHRADGIEGAGNKYSFLDFEFWYDQGDLVVHSNPKLAEQYYLLASRLSDGHSGALANMGYCKIQEGDNQAAINLFLQALRKAPVPANFMQLGSALFVGGDEKGALQLLTNAVLFHCTEHCNSDQSRAWRRVAPESLGAGCVPLHCTTDAVDMVYYWWDAVQQTAVRFQERGQDLSVLQSIAQWDAARVAYISRSSNTSTSLPPAPFLKSDVTLRTPLPPQLKHVINQLHSQRAEKAAQQRQSIQHQSFACTSIPHLMPRNPTASTSFATRRMHIGYYAFNFSPKRSLNGLATGIFSRHDRRRFRVSCFAQYGSHADDSQEERERILNDCDFVTIVSQDPMEAAQMINEAQVHAVIDLVGLIPHHNQGLFAYRPSCIQATAIYAQSTGASYVDLFIGDRVATPPEYESHFSEKIAMLSSCHFVNNQREYARVLSEPRALGKDHVGMADELQMAAFNAFYKMTPRRASSWWTILSRLGSKSTLSFVKYQYWQHALPTLRQHAKDHGIDPSRLTVWGKTKSFEDHLLRVRNASLFLDTEFYNAHTGGIDVLWAGCPAVTTPSDLFSSRVLASLLYFQNATQLIARNEEDFTDLAVAVGKATVSDSRLANAQAMRHVWDALDNGRLAKGAIFDTQAWVDNIERALTHAVDAFPSRVHLLLAG